MTTTPNEVIDWYRVNGANAHLRECKYSTLIEYQSDDGGLSVNGGAVVACITSHDQTARVTVTDDTIVEAV